MRIFNFTVTIAIFLFSVSLLQATTHHVPDEYPTIQAAIDEAVDFDTVLVADGTYTGDGNRDIDFLGKAIVLKSENGPQTCIINCGGWPYIHRGFNFQSGEDSNSVLEGFMIRNAWAYGENGGAIYLNGSSPTIRDNIIIDNTSYYGGGIYCYNNSSPFITGNTITRNSASRAGGICSVNNSSPTIENNMIWENEATLYGGGIYCLDNSSPTIRSNTISWNTARWGGGISCDEASLTTTGNTISGNSASQSGGGIYCDSSAVTVTNSILWNDSPDEIWGVNSSEISVAYSDVEGGWEGEGNIDSDPIFVLPDKLDFRLLWDSPCIDTGHPDYADADMTRSDMGAHFFDQDDYLTLYVTPGKKGVRQGGQIGVTYTLINRWDWDQPFYLLTRIIQPTGHSRNILGPVQYTIPENRTFQVHINYDIPPSIRTGRYEYRSKVGWPPSLLFDSDSFRFLVIEAAY